MDHNTSKGIDLSLDLENGGTACQDETSNEIISGNKQAVHMLGGFRSGFLSFNGSATDECSATSNSGTPGENPHENIELLIDKDSEGQSGEHAPLLEKKRVKEKQKTSSRKAPKPPLPPNGPSLNISDLMLVKEISELAMKKRARIKSVKAPKRMKAENSSLSSPSSQSSSSSSNSCVSAIIVTLIFCLVIIFQGIYSRYVSSANFNGPPEPPTAANSLISIQLYNKIPRSDTIGPTSNSSKSVKHVTGVESGPQDKVGESAS